MTVDRAWASIADRIGDRQVLALEQSAIRIPSTTFEEGKLADHLASYMSDAGLDVEMMEVNHAAKPGKRTRQPIGRLRGTGKRPGARRYHPRVLVSVNVSDPSDAAGCDPRCPGSDSGRPPRSAISGLCHHSSSVG